MAGMAGMGAVPRIEIICLIEYVKNRFCNADAVDSLGQLIIAENIRDVDLVCHPVMIRIDVVTQNAPLMLSRRTLLIMDAVLDIGKGELRMRRSIHVPTGVSTGGHAIIFPQPRKEVVTER